MIFGRYNWCGVCNDTIARGDVRCDRCKKPCPTCHGDVALCLHPLPAEELAPRAVA